MYHISLTPMEGLSLSGEPEEEVMMGRSQEDVRGEKSGKRGRGECDLDVK